MLILARNIDQRIRLQTSDGVIELMVTDIVGGRAWIGVKAPRSVQITRPERGNHEGQQSTPLKGGLEL
jgi:sRNA-binding carbon storage regulator CsrA